MRSILLVLPLLLATGLAQAQAMDCSSALKPQSMPMRQTLLPPLAAELGVPSHQLGAPTGVLAQAFDESQSVDQVLLRLRIESCRTIANALPAPSPGSGIIDPATYKPKTEFDNTPWRFDMSQNGKRMTADEFSAWMKARGVRVAKGTTPGVAPSGTATAAPSGTATGVAPDPLADPATQSLPATPPTAPTEPPKSPQGK